MRILEEFWYGEYAERDGACRPQSWCTQTA